MDQKNKENPKDERASRINDYLKKSDIDPNKNITLDHENTKGFIEKKLFSTTAPIEKPKLFTFEKNKRRFSFLKTYFQSKFKHFKRFSMESLPMIIFLTFSSVVLWKMEIHFNEIQRTITKNKSMKQSIIEDEENEIKKALSLEKFQNKPIEEITNKNRYKFEDDEEFEDEGANISTKAELLSVMLEDYKKGIQIPANYIEEIKNYQMKN